jgi:tRNA-Thr(GGU) m(6)t(6)A37 methyltransferase TsaA
MEFIEDFQSTIEKLTVQGKLPQCEWQPWDFMKPKVPDRGDLCTFAVLRTALHLKKLTNCDYDPEAWCKLIISSLPVLLSAKEVYTENGIINLRLLPNDTIIPKEPENSGFTPIGYLSSCFSEKFATPRQSFYSKYARGQLILSNYINTDALDGLEDFSHIWIIFLFHKSAHSKFKSKVKPPRLNGAKKGIFATRAPHRYNPIGLSLAKIEKIEERSIFVSGIDLIDQTPVLDIKPYHPADSLNEYRVPQYINNPVFVYKVRFHEHAIGRIEFIKMKFTLKFYSSEENWCEIIEEVLAQDPSTVHTKLKHQVIEK